MGGRSADPAIWTLLIGYGALAALLEPGQTPLGDLLGDLGKRTRRAVVWPRPGLGLALGLLILGLTLAPTAKAPPFIYFQF